MTPIWLKTLPIEFTAAAAHREMLIELCEPVSRGRCQRRLQRALDDGLIERKRIGHYRRTDEARGEDD